MMEVIFFQLDLGSGTLSAADQRARAQMVQTKSYPSINTTYVRFNLVRSIFSKLMNRYVH